MVKKCSSWLAALSTGPPNKSSSTEKVTKIARWYRYVTVQYTPSRRPCSFIIRRTRCSCSSTRVTMTIGSMDCRSHM